MQILLYTLHMCTYMYLSPYLSFFLSFVANASYFSHTLSFVSPHITHYYDSCCSFHFTLCGPFLLTPSIVLSSFLPSFLSFFLLCVLMLLLTRRGTYFPQSSFNHYPSSQSNNKIVKCGTNI